MKEVVYYLNDPEDPGKKKVTVVLLKDGQHIARGVAICCGERWDKDTSWEHPPETFLRKRGLEIARGRAKKAFVQQASCRRNLLVNEEARTAVPPIFSNKCEFNPILTSKEQRLLGRL